MLFRARVFDARLASVREELLDGDSREALALRLKSEGLTLVSARRATARSVLGLRSAPARRMDIAWWCRELRTLLVAGMTVVEALETLHAQDTTGERHSSQGALVMNVRRGLSLSAAMTATGGFPTVLVSGVKAGERTGDLVRALDDFLLYHAMLDRLRRQVVSAAIYPAVVVAFGAAVALFLLFFVIPRFGRMYGDLHGSLSWATQGLLATSRALADHGAALAVLALGAVVITTVAWRGGYVGRLAAFASERIGPLRVRIDAFRLAMLYHALALLFRGGYTLDEALEQALSLSLGRRMQLAVGQAKQALTRGRGVAVAFSEAGLTDSVGSRLLAVGERGGSFDRVLQTIGERHASDFNLFVERATRIVEPLLLLVVALVVGSIVVMMYMPIFDMASSIR